MHTKTLIILLGFCLGIICGEKVLYATEIVIVSFVLGVLQMCLYFFEVRYGKGERSAHEKREGSPSLFSCALVTLFFCFSLCAGIMRTQFATEMKSYVCESVCEVKGAIRNNPEVHDDYQNIIIRTNESDTYDISVRTTLYPEYHVGDTVSLFGKATLPLATMEHSGVRTFNYTEYLHIHTIGSEMYFPKIILLQQVTHESLSLIHLKEFKNTLVTYITEYVREPAASLASGMLFGNSSMSKDLLQTFRVAGLSHIIVLSGFNIAVLVSAVLILLRFLPLLLRVSIAFFVIIIFVLAVGAEASIVRATLMTCIALSALLLGKGYIARQGLLISFLLIMVYEPSHLLNDVSLHLSFLATAGIVYMSETLQFYCKRITSTTYREILVTTLSAYIATLPYVMYTFGTVSLYALVTNSIVLPFVPLMMLLSFIVVLAAPLSSILASGIGYVTTQLGDCIIYIAKVTEGLPYASLPISFSFQMMIVVYIFIIVFFIFLQKRLELTKNETSLTKTDQFFSEVMTY